MSRKPGPVKGSTKVHDAHRKRIPIDWDVVDKMLEAGCLGSEIAGELGFSRHTLYDRCVAEKKILFSDYSFDKKNKGDGRLRISQYKKALKGDNTMMVWLGKNRIGQKDNPETIEGFSGKLNEVLDFIKTIKGEDDFNQPEKLE